MPWPLALRRARAEHLEAVIGLVEDAAAWLQAQGTDQWVRPWPTRPGRDRRILTDLQAGRTWIGWDDRTPAATITVSPCPDTAWPDEFGSDAAAYLHRLVVGRPFSHVGLGGQVIDWAAWTARCDHDALWIRLNAWTTNHRLHDYYRKQGFEYCGLAADDGCPSGAMFQRSTQNAKPPEPVLFWEDPDSFC